MKYVLQVKYILYYDRLANLSLFNKLLNIMTSPKKYNTPNFFSKRQTYQNLGRGANPRAHGVCMIPQVWINDHGVTPSTQRPVC
jgi:hypothetical protein